MKIYLLLSGIFGLLGAFNAADEQCSAESTNSDMAGPFWLANAPNRTILYDDDDDGIRLEIRGRVTDLECNALSGVYIDFWQASPLGEYDMDSSRDYKFRGGLYTNEDGEYELFTLYPGIYGVRPRHVHAKVLIDDELQFTTQIYFEGYVGSDSLFDPLRAIKLYPKNQATNDSLVGTFNFIGDWKNPSYEMNTTEVNTTSLTNDNDGPSSSTNMVESTSQTEESETLNVSSTTISDTTQENDGPRTTGGIGEGKGLKSSTHTVGLSWIAMLMTCTCLYLSFEL